MLRCGATHAFLRLWVGDEVGGDEAAVKLHALHHLQLVVQRLTILKAQSGTKVRRETRGYIREAQKDAQEGQREGQKEG